MFNKIERRNNKEAKKKPLTIYTSIRYIYVYIYETVHITSLLMPRHDDVYLLYLRTHSQRAGTKSDQMKNVRTEKKKNVRQKRIRLILRVFFLNYALLMKV